ncbi:4-hydroxybenzoate polyprenyltransferase [Desulfovibrio sp. X2]|uniref:UbiA-like polyprenyltransferase n=1 Tax=Desulfovibrio sp. X2 TaxID=941449 RepID=UPI000358BB44|nr:UbiA-like polyprenyltransferase [Desulfovibrio sp. X2]EPR44715.1 4-hydroxybenzoate polyprenyltransferase [Desulfovibrio sp. X2]
MASQLGVFARMVKIEHSVFALPFAFTGMFWAADGWPGWRPFLLVTVAMVAVRSFAMAFNRLADLDIDRRNPRTQDRPLVTGEMGRGTAWVLTAAMGLVFVAACAAMNPLVLRLSPLALGVAAVYSLTKRFTWLCHFVLGMTLGLAPIGGWLAVTPEFTPPAVLLALGVTFWVAGFDILYACQDEAFDRAQGLHSLPADFGVTTSLTLSSFCHVNTAVFFLVAGWADGAGWIYFAAMLLVGAALVWEHTLIKPDDLSRVNLAFFTLNGVISMAVLAAVLLDIWLA